MYAFEIHNMAIISVRSRHMKLGSNTEVSTGSLKSILSYALVGLWVLLIGLGIWKHAVRAVQPPVYDALTYYQKGKNFWTFFSQGKPINPFSLDPTFRPPGTILMSFPYGFSSDFRAFYFRSVFFPVLCLVSAVYLAGYSRKMNNSEKWVLAILAIFLSTLPMFYHFERSSEIPSPLIWGLVDNFLAGVAALSVAAFLRSMRSISLKWLTVAAFLAAYCLAIKPSGAFVMGLTGATWFMGMIFKFLIRDRKHTEKKQLKKLIFYGCIVIGFIYSGFLAVSLFSRYLSPENLSFGKAAIKIMHDEMELTPELLLKMMRISFGYAFPLLMVFSWGSCLIFWNRMESSETVWTKGSFGVLLGASIFYLAVGVWFWIFVSGGVTQVRYFFPFPLMAVIIVVPIFLAVMQKFPVGMRILVQILLFTPALNILVLLWSAAPSDAWQKWSGVNVSSGTHRGEVEQARDLIKDLRKENRSVLLYSLYSDASTSAFESVGSFEAVVHPSEPIFQTRLPVDWQRPAVIRLDDLLTSEYVIFTPIRNASEKAKALAWKSPQDFWQEQRLFHALLTDLTRKDGVVIVSETSVRLLKIVDTKKLGSVLSEKLKEYSLRPVFVDANPERWRSLQEIEAFPKNSSGAAKNVVFGRRYKVHTLFVSQTGGDIVIKVLWEQIQQEPDKEWYLFCHLIDGKGNILYNQQIYLANRTPVQKHRNIQFDSVLYGSINDPPRVKALAFGVYSPQSSAFLHADAGVRDWNDRRVIVTLHRNRRP